MTGQEALAVELKPLPRIVWTEDGTATHANCGGQIYEQDAATRWNSLYLDEETGVVRASTGDSGDWVFEEWACDKCGTVELEDPPDIQSWD